MVQRTARFLLLLSVLGVGGGFSLARAEPSSDLDYCTANAAAERVGCRGEYQIERGICLGDRAFGRWIDDADSEATYAICILDAKERLRDCYTDVGFCSY